MKPKWALLRYVGLLLEVRTRSRKKMGKCRDRGCFEQVAALEPTTEAGDGSGRQRGLNGVQIRSGGRDKVLMLPTSRLYSHTFHKQSQQALQYTLSPGSKRCLLSKMQSSTARRPSCARNKFSTSSHASMRKANGYRQDLQAAKIHANCMYLGLAQVRTMREVSRRGAMLCRAIKHSLSKSPCTPAEQAVDGSKSRKEVYLYSSE